MNRIIPELHGLIIQYLDHPGDVYKLLLLNKYWHKLSWPFIYRNIRISKHEHLRQFMAKYTVDCATSIKKQDRPQIHALEYEEEPDQDVFEIMDYFTQLSYFKSVFRSHGPIVLKLSHCNMDDATLMGLLSHMTDLETLVLNKMQGLTCTSLMDINHCPKLQKLHLLNWTGSLFIDLYTPLLTELVITRSASTETDQVFCSSPLQKLVLHGVSINDRNLQEILQQCHSSLQTLELSCRAPAFRFKGPGLSQIGDCKRLETLKMSFLDVNSFVLSKISTLSHLKHLSLVHVDGIMDQGMAHLSNLDLSSFYIKGHTLITGSGYQSFLERQSHLVDLHLDGNMSIGDLVLDHVLDSPSKKTLVNLSLDWFNLTRNGFDRFLQEIGGWQLQSLRMEFTHSPI